MLDIRFVRENPELVKENIRKKYQDAKLPLVDEVIELDAKNRAAITEASELRAQKKKLSKANGPLFGKLKKAIQAEIDANMAAVKANDERLAELEKLEEEYADEIYKRMLLIPNIIDPSVPLGPDDSFNVEVERFGEPVVPDYEIPYHTEIMERFNGIDMDAAGKVAGNGSVSGIGNKRKILHRCSLAIALYQAYWGLGIGGALTEACIECARRAGYVQLELEAVAENRAALALYKSAGFVEYGRNPKGFRSRFSGWQELVLMRLELDR